MIAPTKSKPKKKNITELNSQFPKVRFFSIQTILPSEKKTVKVNDIPTSNDRLDFHATKKIIDL